MWLDWNEANHPVPPSAPNTCPVRTCSAKQRQPTSKILRMACSKASDCSCSRRFMMAIFSVRRRGVPLALLPSADSAVRLRTRWAICRERGERRRGGERERMNGGDSTLHTRDVWTGYSSPNTTAGHHPQGPKSPHQCHTFFLFLFHGTQARTHTHSPLSCFQPWLPLVRILSLSGSIPGSPHFTY